MTSAPALLWVDTETSGLDENRHVLLEAGFRVTDSDLRTLGEASWVVTWRSASLHNIKLQAKPEVQEMHTMSGLWKECDGGDGGLPYMCGRDHFRWATAGGVSGKEIAAWLHDAGADGLPLAGSTVGFDRRWLNLWVPDFDRIPHYRSVDVSSVKILMNMWAKDRLADAPVPLKRHRVIPDLDDSIAELAFYRSVLGLDVTAVTR